MMLNFPILPTKISHMPTVTYKTFLGGVATPKFAPPVAPVLVDCGTKVSKYFLIQVI